MRELKCPDCGHRNPDIRELGYTLPYTCGKCPHIWRLQDVADARPLTLAEQVAEAQSIVASWSDEKRANVQLQGEDYRKPPNDRTQPATTAARKEPK